MKKERIKKADDIYTSIINSPNESNRTVYDMMMEAMLAFSDSEKTKVVYEALYNPMIWESSPCTLSIHLTKEGAEKAVAASKAEAKKEYEDIYKNEPELATGKWDDFKYWDIIETEIKP